MIFCDIICRCEDSKDKILGADSLFAFGGEFVPKERIVIRSYAVILL